LNDIRHTFEGRLTDMWPVVFIVYLTMLLVID